MADLMDHLLTADEAIGLIDKYGLTLIEFRVYYYLWKQKRTCTREEIIKNCWEGRVVGTRTIDVIIKRLRDKFGAHIETIHNEGYRLIGS